MMVRPAEEESEAEVRRVDQDNINKFARLNARLHDVRDERTLIKVRNRDELEWTLALSKRWGNHDGCRKLLESSYTLLCKQCDVRAEFMVHDAENAFI